METLQNIRKDTSSGMRVSRTTLPRRTTKLTRRDKSQGYNGTEDVDGVAQAPKVSGPVPADATDPETVQSKLWELQRLINNRHGSLRATYKKNTEANTMVYDLNQKTMQALDTLGEEYEIFEETMKKGDP